VQIDAAAGSNVLRLDNRVDLSVGDVVRIGLVVDVDVEYATIQAIPNRQAAPDAVWLSRPHCSGCTSRPVWCVNKPWRSPRRCFGDLALPTNRNSDQLVVNSGRSRRQRPRSLNSAAALPISGLVEQQRR
jgi:hypothetical protein